MRDITLQSAKARLDYVMISLPRPGETKQNISVSVKLVTETCDGKPLSEHLMSTDNWDKTKLISLTYSEHDHITQLVESLEEIATYHVARAYALLPERTVDAEVIS